MAGMDILLKQLLGVDPKEVMKHAGDMGQMLKQSLASYDEKLATILANQDEIKARLTLIESSINGEQTKRIGYLPVWRGQAEPRDGGERGLDAGRQGPDNGGDAGRQGPDNGRTDFDGSERGGDSREVRTGS